MKILLGSLVIIILMFAISIILCIVGYPISLLINSKGLDLTMFMEYDDDNWIWRRMADVMNGAMFCLILTLIGILGIIAYHTGSSIL